LSTDLGGVLDVAADEYDAPPSEAVAPLNAAPPESSGSNDRRVR